MGVKKVITRILNLVYLGAAGFAIYSLATKPLLSINIKLDVEPANLLAMIPSNNSGENTGGDAHSNVYTLDRSIKRDGNSSGQPDFMSMLTDPEIIDGAFETVHLELPIKLPSLVDFMKIETSQQPLVVKNMVNDLIPSLKEQIKTPLAEGLPIVMEKVAKHMASGAIGDAVKDQIANTLGGGDADSAFNELPEGMIDDMVNNVWGALTNEKQPKAESYHTKAEAEAAAKADEALAKDDREWANGEIIKVAADGAPEDEISYYTYNNPRRFTEITEADVTGVTFTSEVNQFASLKDARDSANRAAPEWGDDYKVKIFANEETKYYQFERLTLRSGGLATTVDDVANVIQESMGSVFEALAGSSNPEVSEKFQDVEVTPELVDEISGAMGGMLREVGLADENGNITDMDQALAALLAGFAEGFGGDKTDGDEKVFNIQTSAISRSQTRDGGEEAPSLEDVLDTLLDSVISLIPMETLDSLNLDEMIGVQGLTMYAWIGIVALCAFPWVLFALITLIRTLRPKKCWTKPWVVFFFAFLQLIFGAAITYGIQYGWAFAYGFVGPTLEGVETVGPFLAGLQAPVIEFLVLIPSLIYLAMIPFTIIYAIFAHGPKKEFKQWKKEKKEAKKAAKLAKKAA